MIFLEKSQKTGFTLIEVVMAIVVAALILMPTSLVVIESARHTYLPEHFTKASSLLKREIDRVTTLRFNDVAAEGPTSYTGSFSAYSYQASFYYVNGSDLNTQAGGPTDYKRVTITISCAGFPDVSAVTLVTNN